MKATRSLFVLALMISLLVGCSKKAPSDPTVHEEKSIGVGLGPIQAEYKREYVGPRSGDPYGRQAPQSAPSK
jgi:hypothetical protein